MLWGIAHHFLTLQKEKNEGTKSQKTKIDRKNRHTKRDSSIQI